MSFLLQYVNLPILVSKDNVGSDRALMILAVTYGTISKLHAPQINVIGYCNVIQPGL